MSDFDKLSLNDGLISDLISEGGISIDFELCDVWLDNLMTYFIANYCHGLSVKITI